MLKELFEELFNQFGVEEFNEALNKAASNENEEEENHTYYHKVVDKYEDGEHVSHIEKEVKDGKVLKDIERTKKALPEEGKEEKDWEKAYNDLQKKYHDLNEKYCSIQEECDRLQEANNFLHQIQKQYNERCDELDDLKTKIKDLIG